MAEKYCFTYCGPVLNNFGTVIDTCWKAETYAVTEKKAKSNLMFRYKQERNMIPNVKITLPNKLRKEKDNGGEL